LRVAKRPVKEIIAALIVSGHALREPVLMDIGAGMENASLQSLFAIAIQTAKGRGRIGAAIIIVFQDIAVAMEPALKMIQIIRVFVATHAFRPVAVAQMMIALVEENAFLVKPDGIALLTAQTTDQSIAAGLAQICRPIRIIAAVATTAAGWSRSAAMATARARMKTATIAEMCALREHPAAMSISPATIASFPAETQVALPVSRNAATMPALI